MSDKEQNVGMGKAWSDNFETVYENKMKWQLMTHKVLIFETMSELSINY